MAAKIDRAASAAHPDAEEVTVELAVSADGRPAPSLSRVGDTTPYVDIRMTLRRVNSAGTAAKAAPEGGARMTRKHQRSITWPSLTRI